MAAVDPTYEAEGMTPVIDGKSREQVRDECLRLRVLLEQVSPEYGKSLQPPELEAEAPEGVRILWDAVGYSTLFRVRLMPPGQKSGRKQVKEVLEAWASDVKIVKAWKGKAPGLEQLPSRFRLVWMSKDRKNLLITDETQAVFDPPVHRVTAASPGHVRVRDSYLRHVSNVLLMCGFSVGPTCCTISFRPPVEGPPLFPLLAPHIAPLSEGVWKVVPHPEVGPMGEPNDFLGYSSLDRFVSYVHGLTGHELTYTGDPRGDFVTVQGLSEELIRGPGLRWLTWSFQSRPQHRAVGTLGGVAVWLKQTGPKTHTLRVAPESRAELVQWLRTQGAHVTREESWRVYFTDADGNTFL